MRNLSPSERMHRIVNLCESFTDYDAMSLPDMKSCAFHIKASFWRGVIYILIAAILSILILPLGMWIVLVSAGYALVMRYWIITYQRYFKNKS